MCMRNNSLVLNVKLWCLTAINLVHKQYIGKERVCACTCICMYIRVNTHVCVYTYMYVHVCKCICVYWYMYTYIYIQIYVHIYIHICLYIHIITTCAHATVYWPLLPRVACCTSDRGLWPLEQAPHWNMHILNIKAIQCPFIVYRRRG